MTRLLTWSVLVGMLIAAGPAWSAEKTEGSDTEGQVAPSHSEQLKELSWMAGEWVDQDEDATVATTCRWSRNGNYLTRMFAVSLADQIDLEGIQIIAFDAAEGKVRSWVFDSDGGLGEGRWTREGNRWTVQSTHVLPDGRKAKATRVITRVDDDAFTLKSTDRELDGAVVTDLQLAVVHVGHHPLGGGRPVGGEGDVRTVAPCAGDAVGVVGRHVDLAVDRVGAVGEHLACR